MRNGKINEKADILVVVERFPDKEGTMPAYKKEHITPEENQPRTTAASFHLEGRQGA